MKNFGKVSLFCGFILASILAESVALAKEKSAHKHVKSLDENTVHYSQSAAESASDSSKRMGLGLSTIGFGPVQHSSITGICELNKDNMIQSFFSIPQTSPLNFSIAAFFKHTLISHSTSGFHIGGGVAVSDTNTGGISGASLGLNFALVGGFHFELPAVPHVVVHLDGGPNFSFINTSPNSQTDFQIGALSPALGASVLYLF